MRARRLFTIGYEGADLADFLATLRACGVEQIIDVRAVPLSRKRGFSKNALAKALATRGIAYVHLRELGDPKPGRDAARRGEFAAFRKIYGQHLKGRDAQAGLKVAAQAADEKLSSLLCFERAHEHCHRSMVAIALSEQSGFAIKHLGVSKGAGSRTKAAYERDGDPALAVGETEAIVIIKAAPQAGQRHGETVCCAGVDLQGHWLRLYPVSFRTLDDGQKFGRWDRIRFKWRLPNDDPRPESRRVDQDSITIAGELKKSERQRFLGGLIVTSLDREREAGRSLALLKANILEFKIEKKPDGELASDKKRFDALHAQQDLFKTKPIIPYQPCPYDFKYRYRTDDGLREGTCQDWEIEATFFNWMRRYGEGRALADMRRVFGVEYTAKGMLLAMGTHSLYPDTWLINGVIRLDEIEQGSLF